MDGEVTGLAADLRLRERLDEAAERRTAVEYGLEALRQIARIAGTWDDPDQDEQTAAATLSRISTIAGEAAGRVAGMRREERERENGR